MSEDDVAKIAGTYHAWRGDTNVVAYADIPGFCNAAKLDGIRKQGHVLTPGRYVGAEAAEDDGEPFDEKMSKQQSSTQLSWQSEGAWVWRVMIGESCPLKAHASFL